MKIFNTGRGDLIIVNVASSQNSFSVDYFGGTIAPDSSVNFNITYSGTGAGSAIIRIVSNDADENPLPIQVYGNTSDLDPGEPAVDFTLPILWKDTSGAYIEESFTLSDHLGQVVWFQIYGSW